MLIGQSFLMLAGQSFLMVTELPSLITLPEENYQLKYTESYTGHWSHCTLVYNDPFTEGYQNCIPMTAV